MRFSGFSVRNQGFPCKWVDCGNPEIIDFGSKILKISKMLPDIFRQFEASIGLVDVIFGLMGVLDMFFKEKTNFSKFDMKFS